MADDNLTYPDGADGLIARWESRRDGFDFVDVPLPPLMVDLTQLETEIVSESALKKHPTDPKRKNSFAAKKRMVAREFVGKSELEFLNAQLIASLRRRDQPNLCADLFHRIWAEKSDFLIKNLDLRWKVSSVTTFADHGKTDVQRELGRGLQVFFGMMKLYEFERTHSGTGSKRVWSVRNRLRNPLPLRMDPFSLISGGLDSAIIAPLWSMAKCEPVMGPLACHLLDELNKDNRNLFRRLAIMRDRALALENVPPEDIPPANTPPADTPPEDTPPKA